MPAYRPPMLYGVSFFSLCAVGLCVAALATNEWYVVDTATSETTVGVYQTCTGGSCKKLSFGDFTTPKCTRKGDDMQRRIHTVFGLTIGGGAAALITLVFSCFAAKSRLTMTLTLIVALLSLGAIAAADIIFPFTFHKYYYCDEPYCDYAFGVAGNTGKCVSFFGYSYALAIVAGACMWTALVMLLQVACCGMEQQPAASEQQGATTAGSAAGAEEQGTEMTTSRSAPPTNSKDSKKNKKSKNDNKSGDRGSAAAPASAATAAAGGAAAAGSTSPSAGGPAARNGNDDGGSPAGQQMNAPPEGMEGWELDANTGLYWSDTEKLFYDAGSGHFYDPKSELWYDPTTQQWYQGSDQ